MIFFKLTSMVIGILLFFSAAYAQSNPKKSTQYWLDGNIEWGKHVRLEDGSDIFAGYAFGPAKDKEKGAQIYLSLSKLFNGEERTTHIFSEDPLLGIYDETVVGLGFSNDLFLNQKNIVTAGKMTWNDPKWPNKSLIFLVDKDLNLIKALSIKLPQEINGEKDFVFKPIQLEEDNAIIVIGVSDSGSNPFIAKIDRNTKPEWAFMLPGKAGYIEGSVSRDKTMYVMMNPGHQSNDLFYIAAIASDGKPLWKKDFPKGLELQSINPAQDGKLLVMARRLEDSGNGSRHEYHSISILLSIAQDAHIEWALRMPELLDNNCVDKIVSTKDGGALLSAPVRRDNIMPITQATLIKFSSEKTIEWSGYVDFSDACAYTSLDENGDGSISGLVQRSNYHIPTPNGAEMGFNMVPRSSSYVLLEMKKDGTENGSFLKSKKINIETIDPSELGIKDMPLELKSVTYEIIEQKMAVSDRKILKPAPKFPEQFKKVQKDMFSYH